MNKITADGRVVADAETRFTSAGDAVTSFRLASDIGYGDKKTTNWFNVTVWGKRGESIAQYLTKGTPVTVYGSLQLREYQAADGTKKISPDIRSDEITLHGGRQDGERQPSQRNDPNSYSNARDGRTPPAPRRNDPPPSRDYGNIDDDIPF